MSDSIYDLFDDYFKAVAVAHAEAIEKACESALQSGTCGVIVVRNSSDPTTIQVGISNLVPYGQQYHFDSLAAFQAWSLDIE